MKPQRHRSFIAIFPPPEAIDKLLLIQSKLKKADGHVRWEKEEKFHFTLQFWGDQTEEWLTKIYAELTLRLSHTTQFTIAITKVGCFPNKYSPKIFWAGSEPLENPELVQVAEIIQQTTRQHGVPPEQKPFHPHITIGRGKGKINPDLLQNLETITFHPIMFHCREIRIMKSILASSGSTYTTLSTIPLT
ncbi:MAG: RNA 2',3'-cyclic phosphodiesterase [Bacteroidota bacterium]